MLEKYGLSVTDMKQEDMITYAQSRGIKITPNYRILYLNPDKESSFVCLAMNMKAKHPKIQTLNTTAGLKESNIVQHQKARQLSETFDSVTDRLWSKYSNTEEGQAAYLIAQSAFRIGGSKFVGKSNTPHHWETDNAGILEIVKTALKRKRDDDFLFPNLQKYDGALRVNSMFKEIGDGNLTSKDFRKFWATKVFQEAMDRGTPYKEAKQMAMHRIFDFDKNMTMFTAYIDTEVLNRYRAQGKIPAGVDDIRNVVKSDVKDIEKSPDEKEKGGKKKSAKKTAKEGGGMKWHYYEPEDQIPQETIDRLSPIIEREARNDAKSLRDFYKTVRFHRDGKDVTDEFMNEVREYWRGKPIPEDELLGD